MITFTDVVDETVM